MELELLQYGMEYGAWACFMLFLLYLNRTQMEKQDALIVSFQKSLMDLSAENTKQIDDLRARYDKIIQEYRDEKDQAVQSHADERKTALMAVQVTLDQVHKICGEMADQIRAGMRVVEKWQIQQKAAEIADRQKNR